MSIYKHIRDNEDVLTKENLLNIVHLLSDSISDHLDKDEKCKEKIKDILIEIKGGIDNNDNSK